MTRDDYLKIAVAAVASGVVGAFFKKLFDILPTEVSLSGFLALTLFVVLAWRTFERLEGREKEPGSDERARFEAFRQDLVDGGTPARVYNLWLGRGLDAVDRFFGDAGRADRSWVARLMRLETPGPRWTAVAYDRCLLLAYLYPVAVVFVVWVISGRVGPAEAALGLGESAAGWTWDTAKRIALAITFILSARLHYLMESPQTSHKLAIFLKLSACLSISIYLITTMNPLQIENNLMTNTSTTLLPVFFAIFFVNKFYINTTKGRNYYLFYLALISIFISIITLPYFLSAVSQWTFIGAELLFYLLFALINAPIDWLALGFTRALLRKGLVKSGWWPFGFALVDLAVAAVLVAGLAFVLVFAVQFFDDMAALGGGPEARILPLRPLFARLHDTPTAYEVWWVWAMLFSSMIPSFVNLTIAAAAFLRGLPAVHARVLARLEPDRALGTWDRIELAATLAGQVVIGGMLAIGVFYLAAMVVLPMVLPAFAHLLLTFADGLAEADLPAQMIEVFRHR